MKISVFGQRNITDISTITTLLEMELTDIETNITYIHGGAKGPQEIIYNYLKNTVDCVLFRPWTMISNKLAKQAMTNGKFDPVYFFFRNIQIIENSDLVFIFDNGDQDAEVYKVISLCEKKDIKYKRILLNKAD